MEKEKLKWGESIQFRYKLGGMNGLFLRKVLLFGVVHSEFGNPLGGMNGLFLRKA
jgi:hypothetical protein